MSGAVFELFMPMVALSDIGCERLLSYSFTGCVFFFFFAGVLKIELFFFPIPDWSWVLSGGVVLAKQ